MMFPRGRLLVIHSTARRTRRCFLLYPSSVVRVKLREQEKDTPVAVSTSSRLCLNSAREVGC